MTNLPDVEVDPTRLVFVGGLHRSGTTLLGRVLADHPQVSGFADTGATEDEGQHLQTVYAAASAYGGAGRFAFHPDAHLTEADPSSAADLARQLLREWSRYWDFGRSILVEKSPPNLLMGRWLQSLFPGSALVVIIRHPVVVALATKKWRRTVSLVKLVDHWFRAHDVLASDAYHLRRLHILRYEDLLIRPRAELVRLEGFLQLAGRLDADRLDASRTNPYVEAWSSLADGGPLGRRSRATIVQRFGPRMAEYGYSASDLQTVTPWNPPWEVQKWGRRPL